MANFLNQTSMEPNSEAVSSNNPGKPSMEQAPGAAARKGKPTGRVMAEDAQPDKSGKGPMGKFTASRKAASSKAVGEQKPKRARRTAESYLRLRVRVENGNMSIVDARQVEGPLIQSSIIQNGYVAELLHNGNPVAVEAIADLGERRPYFDPGRALVEGAAHGSFDVPTAEFALRIPSGAMLFKNLPKAEIALYQIKDSSQPLRTRAGASLRTDYQSEVREVARLKGVNMTNLSKAAQASVKRVLK